MGCETSEVVYRFVPFFRGQKCTQHKVTFNLKISDLRWKSIFVSLFNINQGIIFSFLTILIQNNLKHTKITIECLLYDNILTVVYVYWFLF